jgi:hypothetical protein
MPVRHRSPDKKSITLCLIVLLLSLALAQAASVQKLRGITYSPVDRGYNRTDPFQWETHIDDIALFKISNIDTVRTYYPIVSMKFLDALYASGIQAIVGIPYLDDRNISEKYDIYSGTYTQYIRKYGKHPAIYMVEYGNEYNYHPEWFGNDISNWYFALEGAAARTKLINPALTVSTAHGEVPTEVVLTSVPSVDVWGMNVYRGTTPSSAVRQFLSISSKRVYLSEVGADAFNGTTQKEDQLSQYDWNRKILKDVTKVDDPRFLGIVFMTFNDELWKHPGGSDFIQEIAGHKRIGASFDNELNEEWFGFFSIDREPRKTYGIFNEGTSSR